MRIPARILFGAVCWGLGASALAAVNANFLVKKCPLNGKVVNTSACTTLVRKTAALRFAESEAELSADQIRNAGMLRAEVAGYKIILASWLKTVAIANGKATRLKTPQRVVAIQVQGSDNRELRRDEFPVDPDKFSSSTFVDDHGGARYIVEVTSIGEAGKP